MHVLITGHRGFIGPEVTRTFKNAGWTVTGVDTNFYPIHEDEACRPTNEFVADLRTVGSEIMSGVNVVVHLAGLSNDPLGELKPGLTEEINQGASRRIAQMAKDAGVSRFIFASSCSIYGAADVSKPLDETASFNPVSSYAVSKVQTESDLSAMADDSFTPIYMRNATVYGVSNGTRMDLVVNQLTAGAMVNNEIRVMSDGTPWRPLVHVEDVARATLALAEAPKDKVHNQAFNIGRNDGNYQVSTIANLIHDQLPDAALVITGEAGGDPRSYQVSFDKLAKTLPEFQLKWTLEKGITQVINWVKEGGLNNEPFNSRQFIRLKQIKHLIETNSVDESLYMRR